MANPSVTEVTLLPSFSVAFAFRSTDGARCVCSGTHDILIMVVYGTIVGDKGLDQNRMMEWLRVWTLVPYCWDPNPDATDFNCVIPEEFI